MINILLSLICLYLSIKVYNIGDSKLTVLYIILAGFNMLGGMILDAVRSINKIKYDAVRQAYENIELNKGEKNDESEINVGCDQNVCEAQKS